MRADRKVVDVVSVLERGVVITGTGVRRTATAPQLVVSTTATLARFACLSRRMALLSCQAQGRLCAVMLTAQRPCFPLLRLLCVADASRVIMLVPLCLRRSRLLQQTFITMILCTLNDLWLGTYFPLIHSPSKFLESCLFSNDFVPTKLSSLNATVFSQPVENSTLDGSIANECVCGGVWKAARCRAGGGGGGLLVDAPQRRRRVRFPPSQPPIH
jgi:hypothetical protein